MIIYKVIVDFLDENVDYPLSFWSYLWNTKYTLSF